jgi:hypothetical protein
MANVTTVMGRDLRDKLSVQTRTIFEMISAHIVEVIYNTLYSQAKTLYAEHRAASVTEGYKIAVKWYLEYADGKRMAQKPFYYHTISGIQAYFKRYSSFISISFADCINKIIREFVPEDYLEQITPDRRDSFLTNVFQSVIKKFMFEVLNKLDYIIDREKHNEVSVRMLQDIMVDILANEKETWFLKFVVSGKAEASVDSDVIPKIRVAQIMSQIQQLLNEVEILKQKLQGCATIIKRKNAIIRSLEHKNADLQQQIDTLRGVPSVKDETGRTIPLPPRTFPHAIGRTGAAPKLQVAQPTITPREQWAPPTRPPVAVSEPPAPRPFPVTQSRPVYVQPVQPIIEQPLSPPRQINVSDPPQMQNAVTSIFTSEFADDADQVQADAEQTEAEQADADIVNNADQAQADAEQTEAEQADAEIVNNADTEDTLLEARIDAQINDTDAHVTDTALFEFE